MSHEESNKGARTHTHTHTHTHTQDGATRAHYLRRKTRYREQTERFQNRNTATGASEASWSSASKMRVNTNTEHR